MFKRREDNRTDDIVVLEGHVPRNCFEEIQIENSNDENHQLRINTWRNGPFLTDVLSKPRIIWSIDSD